MMLAKIELQAYRIHQAVKLHPGFRRELAGLSLSHLKDWETRLVSARGHYPPWQGLKEYLALIRPLAIQRAEIEARRNERWATTARRVYAARAA